MRSFSGGAEEKKVIVESVQTLTDVTLFVRSSTFGVLQDLAHSKSSP